VTNVRSAVLERAGLQRPGDRAPFEWQPSLLDAAVTEPDLDGSFARAERIALDREAWVEYVPGWVSGATDLFDAVVHGAPWTHRTVPMYGRMVEEPRLTAWYGSDLDDPTLPTLVPRLAGALSDRYERSFDAVGAALYRDGRDSVAWHSDRIDPKIIQPVVAILSLGSPRKLRLRAKFRRNDARSVALFPGDLLVMGGMAQSTWEHSIPKVARAGPRLSLQFRHSH
jgi:alkylated DNA repair dioxygenase AlkB